MNDYVPDVLENSAKFSIFFAILDETIRVGDRILLFSQSLFTLGLLEQFLQERCLPDTEIPFRPGVNYFRLDGSTPVQERERLINEFNAAPNGVGPGAVPLFLVSTRAGSLGVNLVGANRVVVLDASWNPCHDSQAVCRVYRYGQEKNTFIYRLVADNTIERKIYDRQINKQGMADRVVDESNPDNYLYSKDINSLICDEKDDPPVESVHLNPEEEHDPVTKSVLALKGDLLTKAPFPHESLLIDRKEKKLTKSEKRLAEKTFEIEKGVKASYQRTSYAQYYPKAGDFNPNLLTSNGITRHRYGIPPPAAAPPPRVNMPIRPTFPSSSTNPIPSTSTSGYSNNYTPLPLPPQKSFNTPPPPQNSFNTYMKTSSLNETLEKKGMKVQPIVLKEDLTVPMGVTGDQAPFTLKKGQNLTIIETPNGTIYWKLGEKFVRVKYPMDIFNQNRCKPRQQQQQEVIDLSDDDDDNPNAETAKDIPANS